MSFMSNYEYYKEVRAIANALVCEAMADNNNDADLAMDDIMDCRLHETIDGHQWVIYNGYNLDIIKHSDNADYMIDNIGGDEEVLKHSGISGLHQAIAFWALYADVQELLQDELDKFVDSLDSKK